MALDGGTQLRAVLIVTCPGVPLLQGRRTVHKMTVADARLSEALVSIQRIEKGPLCRQRDAGGRARASVRKGRVCHARRAKLLWSSSRGASESGRCDLALTGLHCSGFHTSDIVIRQHASSAYDARESASKKMRSTGVRSVDPHFCNVAPVTTARNLEPSNALAGVPCIKKLVLLLLLRNPRTVALEGLDLSR